MRYTLRPSIKQLSVRRRHLGITSRGKLEAKALKRALDRVLSAIGELQAVGASALSLIKLYSLILDRYKEVALIPVHVLRQPLPKITRKGLRIADLKEEELHIHFRFRTKQQLYRLLDGFQFPDTMQAGKMRPFTREEVLLVGLYRLARPTRLVDAGFQFMFGFNEVEVSLAFQLFLNHLVDNWAYLLKDNMAYWKPKLPEFATAIRNKLYEKYNCYFPPVEEPAGGFRVFGFIDNTMNASCRPGGGPARDGTDSPRNDRMLQQAWYNGWKKLHGMKWQTVDLPNGMNFHVWGPFSVRHNDLYSLDHSNINDLIANLMGNGIQFIIYGDSAYCVTFLSHISARYDNDPNTDRQNLENRSLSSCREVIEWDYGDIGKYWAFVDFKKNLKLRKMMIGRIYFVAMLLRNAYVTMNGCNTATFYDLLPPDFEDWVKQGMRQM